MRLVAVVDCLGVLLLPGGAWWWAPPVLALAAVVPVVVARRAGDDRWALAGLVAAVAAAFFSTWVVAAAAGLVGVTGPDPAAVAAMLAPWAGVVVALGVLADHRLRTRRPLAAGTAVAVAVAAGTTVAVAAVAAAAQAHRPVLVGILLLADGALAEVVGGRQRRPAWAAGGVVAGTAGTALVAAGSGAGHLLPVVLLGPALVAALVGRVPVGRVPVGVGRRAAAHPGTDGPRPWGGGGAVGPVGWDVAHAAVAVAVAAVAAAASLAALARTGSRPADAAVALLTVGATSLVVALEGRRAGMHRWTPWAAATVASLGALPLARWAGAVDPQWYVLGPGSTLVGVGVLLPRAPWRAAPAAGDRAGDDAGNGAGDRAGRGPRQPGPAPGLSVVDAGRLVTAAGLAVLLGTTFVQVLQATGSGATGPTVLLVAEGAAAVAAGVALHRQVPVLGGGAAAAAGALAALARTSSSETVDGSIAVVALALLVAATVVVARRSRWRPVPLTTGWRTWP